MKQSQLDMAEQQLFGWNAAEQGERLESLVDGMGLTLEEWDKLEENNSVNFLSYSQRNEIINHLREK